MSNIIIYHKPASPSDTSCICFSSKTANSKPTKPQLFINGDVSGLACWLRLAVALLTSASSHELFSRPRRLLWNASPFLARVHPYSLCAREGTTWACARSHHDGQSKGGGPSLLLLVAILLHFPEDRTACWVNASEVLRQEQVWSPPAVAAARARCPFPCFMSHTSVTIYKWSFHTTFPTIYREIFHSCHIFTHIVTSLPQA